MFWVKIIKSSEPTYWYNKYIGCVFKVRKCRDYQLEPENVFEVINDENLATGEYIGIDDCSNLSREEKIKRILEDD